MPATPPSTFGPGVSTINAPAGIGGAPTLEYDAITHDPNQIFRYTANGVEITGVLEEDLIFKFATPWTLTAQAALGAGFINGVSQLGGPTSGAIAGRLQNRTKLQTELSWDSADANYIDLDLKFTLISVRDANKDVLTPWLDACKLVLPASGGTAFAPPLQEATGTLEVGSWLWIPNLYAKSLISDVSRIHMKDGLPFYVGLELGLVSKWAINWDDFRSYVYPFG